MKVDEHISEAIAKYLEENGVQAKEFCQRFSVSEAAFSNWRRVGRGIQQRNWQELFPYIRNYLPASRIYIDAAGVEQYKSAIDLPDEKQQYVSLTFTVQSVPKFGPKQLEKFNAALESIEQLAVTVDAPRIEYRPKTPGCGHGIFALKTKGSVAVPSGSVVFASTDLKPVDGGLVVYLGNDGKVGVANFSINGNFFELQGKTKILGETSKILEYVRWIFPVVYYYVVTY